MVVGRALLVVVINVLVFQTAVAIMAHHEPRQPPPPHRPPRLSPPRKRASKPPPYADPCTTANWQAKTLDVILYGATGYTGRLAANYLAKGLSEKLKWAIAGRDKLKLNYLHAELGNKTNEPEVIWVGLRNEEKLSSEVEKAKVILNFAGPYEKNNGESVIRAALDGCTHYVDVSTETFWNAQVLKTYGGIAKARGVALVQSAGFASLASDFLAMSALNDAMKSTGQLPLAVNIVWKTFNDGNSGGQFATSKYEEVFHGRIKDPYILSPETSHENKLDWKLDGVENYAFNEAVNTNLQKFNMAEKDCPVIRRSINMKYQKPCSVQGAADFSMYPKRLKFLANPGVTASEAIPLKIPSPGEGPPGWVRSTGAFAGTAIVYANATRVQVSVEGHGSPNFVGTPRMASEMAVGLAFHGPANSKGGYLTPSLALGLDLLEHRLSQVDQGRLIIITHDISHPQTLARFKDEVDDVPVQD